MLRYTNAMIFVACDGGLKYFTVLQSLGLAELCSDTGCG